MFQSQEDVPGFPETITNDSCHCSHDKAVAPLIERAIDNGEFTEEEQKILKENLKIWLICVGNL